MSTYHSQARSGEAKLLLQKITTYLEEIGHTYNLEILNAFQVELALNQGQITHAHRLSLTVDFTMRPLLWFYYIPQLTPLKLLLHQGGSQNLEEVQTQLVILDEHLLEINRKTIRVDVLAMQALLFYKQNDFQSAYYKLCDSLALAKPGGFIQNYLDWGSQMAELLMLFYQEGKFKHKKFEPHVTKILAAFPATAFTQSKQTSSHSAKKLVRLTKREMEVLAFLATDLSPEEIGEQLEISTATVRTHARNIYKKLKVNGRFHAVYRAKELGLLTSF